MTAPLIKSLLLAGLALGLSASPAFADDQKPSSASSVAPKDAKRPEGGSTQTGAATRSQAQSQAQAPAQQAANKKAAQHGMEASGDTGD
ncbi:MAG TPA: hypothetical protein VFA75_17170 [Nevskia sp.]|nr:hypothetical protein [Nevskia sp.]